MYFSLFSFRNAFIMINLTLTTKMLVFCIILDKAKLSVKIGRKAAGLFKIVGLLI